MAQTLRKKFKKVVKSRKVKIRDICILTSQYLKKYYIDFSPLDLKKISGEKDLEHNFMLARAHYGKQFNIDLPGAVDELPTKAGHKSYVTLTDYSVHQYDKETDEFTEITKPLNPGTTLKFDHEDQTEEKELSEEE